MSSPIAMPWREGGVSRRYGRHDVADGVRFYAGPALRPPIRLGARDYARAQAALPTWCIDALPCGHTEDGQAAVVLVVRGKGPGDGPFRGEPWVVGGKWDMVTPWKEFAKRRLVSELFNGRPASEVIVAHPIGNQLFATGWDGADGRFGLHGVTVQLCYQAILTEPVSPELFRPDRNHSGCVVLRAGEAMPEVHPYVRDVIRLSGWLAERQRT